MEGPPPTTPFVHGPRRAVHVEVDRVDDERLDTSELAALERFDLAVRTLFAILYNFVPRSGHPGGAASSARILETLLLSTMATDVSDPLRGDQDVLVLAAGHKAMGLYALLALRDEAVRIVQPSLLPSDARLRVRLEDLLGFRRNPVQPTPLFRKMASKALDGHPTPAVAFVKVATGPSGVGVGSAVGLALGLADAYGSRAPKVHVVEGEGGLTPGRVSEAMASCSASELDNLVLHVDHNQSTIDSDRCCRDGDVPGDYVQWEPAELARLHDFNVVRVASGFDLPAVARAQRIAAALDNGRPTCVVYRTVKGWRYGIEGRKSHGAGHGFLSESYHRALEPFERTFGVTFGGDVDPSSDEDVERGLWEALCTVRGALGAEEATARAVAARVQRAARAVDEAGRRPVSRTLRLDRVFEDPAVLPEETPPDLALEPGTRIALREQLGRCLGHLCRASGGAVMGASADLLDSTSLSRMSSDRAAGFFARRSNPGARIVSAGGICEDAMGAIMAGLSSAGTHMGVSSSYAAFIAPLEHIAARCHAIGQQAKREVVDEPPHPFVIVMGHSSLKTGEDGPTHADPQPLQMYQESFPAGSCCTLTPWEPAEIWPCLSAALRSRPAVVAAFVTRPVETVPDRRELGIAGARAAGRGLYRARAADPGSPRYGGAVVIQGSGVAYEFFDHVLPALDREGVEVDVVVVTCVELFDALDPAERERIFPERLGPACMGVTDFTLPTLYRFVTSAAGREASLHPFRRGLYPGSGRAERVMEQAGLDGPSQLAAVRAWADAVRGRADR
jgi:transketolase